MGYLRFDKETEKMFADIERHLDGIEQLLVRVVEALESIAQQVNVVNVP